MLQYADFKPLSFLEDWNPLDPITPSETHVMGPPGLDVKGIQEEFCSISKFIYPINVSFDSAHKALEGESDVRGPFRTKN